LPSWHDVPFEQPSCLQFKSVVLFIQATRQWDLNRRWRPCQWKWVFMVDKETAGEKYIYTRYICLREGGKYFFGSHSSDTNVFLFEKQYNFLV
jgi:hypothetical protein